MKDVKADPTHGLTAVIIHDCVENSIEEPGIFIDDQKKLFEGRLCIGRETCIGKRTTLYGRTEVS